MLRHVLDLLNHSIFVRTVGSLSCVVALLCYALSSSFKSLFGEWNPTKIVLYIILSSIITVVVLFADKSRVSFVSKLKPHVEFLVLMLTSLYSFFADRSTKGKPDTWSVVSSVAFALTSLCLSRQIKPGFDVGLFSFFLGCVTVQLMKIHLIFILVAAGFCYPLVVLRSYSESRSENGESSAQELKEILIDNINTASFGMGQDKKTSENGDSSAEGIDDDDDANRELFGMGQDKAGQITHRRHVGNVAPSPSPPPPPSTRLTQDDDRSPRSPSGEGGSSSSSNYPLLARLPAHGNNKSFEKLPEAADAEPFLSDLQELERSQLPLLVPDQQELERRPQQPQPLMLRWRRKQQEQQQQLEEEWQEGREQERREQWRREQWRREQWRREQWRRVQEWREQERQDDEDIGGGMTKATNLEDIQGLGGPMTKVKAKKVNLLVNLTQAQVRRKKRPK